MAAETEAETAAEAATEAATEADAEEAAVRAHYARGEERDRLSDGRGQLEVIRTTEILARRLPPPPAVIADIGGGPGRYALRLASLGYHVEHRDLIPLHVSQLRADADAAGGLPQIRTAIGDARELDLPDESADAVLLLGPLYHLANGSRLSSAWSTRPSAPGSSRRCTRVTSPPTRTARPTSGPS